MIFDQTPQQDKWYKEGACIKYKKQGHYTKDYKQGQGTNTAKGTSILQGESKIKAIRECTIKSFIFCYNNHYPVHQDAKYGASYWPQEPKLDKLKGTEEADLLQELDQNLIATFSNALVKAVLQEYV